MSKVKFLKSCKIRIFKISQFPKGRKSPPKEDREREIRSVDGWVRAHLDWWDPDSRVDHYHAADDEKIAPDMSTTITTSPPPPD